MMNDENLLERYERDGYAVAKGVFSGQELRDLQRETKKLIEAAPNILELGEYQKATMPDGSERPFRVEWLTDPNKRQVNESLSLAPVSPLVCDIISGILGPDWTFVSAMMVFKTRAGGPEVSLHRDDLPDRKRFSPEHRVVSADVALDPIDTSNGCLRVIPGSHLWNDVRRDVHQNLTHPDLVPLEVSPGDVVFHDGQLLHGSPATPPGTLPRRILYFVYQDPRWLLEEGYVAGLVPPRSWVAELIKLTDYLSDLRSVRYAEGRRYRVPSDWEVEAAAADLKLSTTAVSRGLWLVWSCGSGS